MILLLSKYDSIKRMQTVTEWALERAGQRIFTREQAAFWAGGRGASLHALLKRAVASREIWRLRRGLYGLADRVAQQRRSPGAGTAHPRPELCQPRDRLVAAWLDSRSRPGHHHRDS